MLARLFALVLALTLAAGVTMTNAAQPEIAAASAAAKYVKGLQNADGGFPAFGTDSAPGSTIDAAFAFVAAGYDPTVVTSTAGNGPDDYLATQAASYSSDPGAAAKLTLGVLLMGLNPSGFGGVDLLAVMDSNYDDMTGSYGLDLFDEAFYMLALVAAGQPVPAAARQYVASLQQVDGGWEFASGFGTDTNTTAMVLQALLAAGMPTSDQVAKDALSYLAGAQNADGGFGFITGVDSDPNSTALVLQALVAAGQNIDEGGPWAPGGNTSLEGLLAFRNPTTGAFQFFGEDSAFATYQAVPALVLGPFPAVRPTKLVGSGDTDGDGCTDEQENGANELAGGRRSYLNPWDYMNPTQDGLNRVDDILMAVGQYFIDAPDPNYTTLTDRTHLGPDPWDFGKPNGRQRVDDILAALKSYFHDCA